MAGDGKARPTPLHQLVAVEPWRKYAACAGHSRLAPTAWDDVATEIGREDDEARERRIDAAKAVCRTECLVRAECLRDADPRTDSGVRGGEDMRDVKEARRKARRRAS